MSAEKKEMPSLTLKPRSRGGDSSVPLAPPVVEIAGGDVQCNQLHRNSLSGPLALPATTWPVRLPLRQSEARDGWRMQDDVGNSGVTSSAPLMRLGVKRLIDDFHPSVLGGEHIRRILRSLLSVADGVKLCRG